MACRSRIGRRVTEGLRLAEIETEADVPTGEAEALPGFLAGEADEAARSDDPDEPQPHAIAAE